MKRRVVITGIGTINPLGDSPETFYENLIAGKSGLRRWKSIDLSAVECKIGGDLGDMDLFKAFEKHLPLFEKSHAKKVKKLFKGTTFSGRMTMVCTLDAWKDAGLFDCDFDPYTVSLPVGGHNFNSNYIFENCKQFLEEPDFIDPLSSVEGIDPNLPALVAETLELHGPSFTLGGACASGNLALRQGFLDIQSGECDTALVTGPPFDVSPADIQASVILSAVVVKPEYQEKPEIASRPFDRDRCGFLYSHGSAALVIEDLEKAKSRGAKIYGELLGVAANSNGNHLPMPSARNQQRVMETVLRMTDVKPEEVDYVNFHATSTHEGDIKELEAVKKTFGEHVYKLKMNAPKSMLGHTCWASPLVETVAGLMQMRYGRLHPTINLDNPDPVIDGLDMCANETRNHHINVMLKNSFGFGGVNSCSLIRRFEG